MTSPDDYAAIHAGAAIGAIAPRGQIALAGPDRAAFLHGLLTNDTASLTAGHGCYAAWLTPQGRMLCDLHVFESGDMMLLDVAAAEVQPAADRLEQFHFTEDVQIATLATLRSVWIHGPAAPGILGAGFDAWMQYQNARIELAGVSVVVARIDQLAVPGFVVYVDAQQEDEVTAALVARGALHATPATLDAARIEAGYPVFGIDMTADTIPLEAGIEDRAISLTKGCYVGQEVIVRVTHRGGGRVAKKLVKWIADPGADIVPLPDSRVFSFDKDIGRVTSAAFSPNVNRVVGLGYVHRDFTERGTDVTVMWNDSRIKAVVQ